MKQALELNRYPSSRIGNIHRMLLIVEVFIFSIVLLCTLFYVFAFGVYLDYLSIIDQALMSFGAILYYIVLLTFFIWLVQVHRALKQRYLDYPIGAVGAVVWVLPLINLIGLGYTFSTIAGYLEREAALHKHAKRIRRLILPLYIAFFISSGINRYIRNNLEFAGDGMILTGAFFDAASLALYLWLTIQINTCIRHLNTVSVQTTTEFGDAQHIGMSEPVTDGISPSAGHVPLGTSGEK